MNFLFSDSFAIRHGRCLLRGGLASFGTALASFVAFGATDPFGEGVRTTDPLTPQQQRDTFHLPPGFEIQLVAAEPDINKPMNLAFDAKGRLWVTTSIEYPFAAPTNRVGRDRVMIFEDFGSDGRARKVTPFADGLNIPIGIYPLTGIRRTELSPLLRSSEHLSPEGGVFGNAAIVWSIPNIWLLDDYDGDGKVDRRTPLYGPFDHTRDTHGNQASFRRGFDGWLYATHGFNNDSHVKGRDDHEVHLNSGNVYRMRLDGSRIEHFTHGQVNPFGLAWDPRGNLYSSDCHSAPIYQLLAGGYYPSFGKPHDGLGFAPTLMEHAHGSTAIDGIVYYADNLWPEEFRENILLGNVMTSRLNRDRLEFQGSTPKAVELPDFLRTDDPWFRPVDNQLGPDGALYIADFYNRIIGHYEVPLMHPGRDRERGRIWRVVYTGNPGTRSTASQTSSSRSSENLGRGGTRPHLHERKLDLTTATASQLIRELGDPNLTWRMLAMSQLCDRIGKAAIAPLRSAIGRELAARTDRNSPDNSGRALRLAHALWALHRLGGLATPAQLPSSFSQNNLRAAARDASPLVRTHALRMLAEQFSSGITAMSVETATPRSQLAVAALDDTDPLVQRCAVEVLGAYPKFASLSPLLALLHRVPKEDTHLLYVLRKSIRDLLNDEATFAKVGETKWNEADLRALADVAVAVKSERAGSFLSRQIVSLTFDRATLVAVLHHIARYAPASEVDQLGVFVPSKFANDLDLQLALFRSARDGLAQRDAALGGRVRAWGGELAERLLSSVREDTAGWQNVPDDGLASTANPWILQKRPSADGNKDSWFICSLPPGGEQLTGLLRSPAFRVPPNLEFFVAGHDGPPGKMAQKKNFVRLRAADTQAALAESSPPRNDVAQLIAWDLSAHAGKLAYLEVADGDNGNAYAWLAVGRFDPPVVALPTITPRQASERQSAAAQLARALALSQLAGSLSDVLTSAHADSEVRVAAARALVSFDRTGAKHLPAIVDLFSDVRTPLPLRAKLGPVLMEDGSGDGLLVLMKVTRESPYRLQLPLASAIAARQEGAEALLLNMEAGTLPARLLQDRALKDKLLAAKPNHAPRRIEQLAKGLASANEQIEKLIDQRRRAFDSATASADNGTGIFSQSCAVCHRLAGAGNLIGPQLDGIGNRGLERLLEDILDPNRNVDRAFRTHIMTLKNGDVVSGLPRREEGGVWILADSIGKEFSVRTSDIASRRESELSPMPGNLGDALSAEQLNDLLAYLLSNRAAQK